MADSPAVVPVEVTFTAVDTLAHGETDLAERFTAAWPAYRRWYLRDGEAARPSTSSAGGRSRRTCPSCSPTYDRFEAAVGGGDLAARFLSHWNPPPLFAACSLAAWSRERNVLVRNYDYPPTLCDAMVVGAAGTAPPCWR